MPSKEEKDYFRLNNRITKRFSFFNITEKDSINPYLAYKDGIEVILVYREHSRTLAIYSNPSLSYDFTNRLFNGIQFVGHANYAISPKNYKVKEKDIPIVIKELAEELVD